MKLFKKEIYGLDVCVKDAEAFKEVLQDFDYKVEDLGGETTVTTLKIEAPKKALKRLVEMYSWTGGVCGPYKRV